MRGDHGEASWTMGQGRGSLVEEIDSGSDFWGRAEERELGGNLGKVERCGSHGGVVV